MQCVDEGMHRVSYIVCPFVDYQVLLGAEYWVPNKGKPDAERVLDMA